MPDYYTRYPRPILWLVPGGTVGDAEVEPFYISKLPVTNEQLEAFDRGFLRSAVSPGDDDPAVGVSWEDASGYCRWYAGVSRKPMRLPSELEWEHACRAGATGRFFWGDDPAEAESYVWSAENSGTTLPRLDAKRANGHGLFGMLGGVWEWTEERVLRGGSFREPVERCTCETRREIDPKTPREDAGFRIVKSLR